MHASLTLITWLHLTLITCFLYWVLHCVFLDSPMMQTTQTSLLSHIISELHNSYILHSLSMHGNLGQSECNFFLPWVKSIWWARWSITLTMAVTISKIICWPWWKKGKQILIFVIKEYVFILWTLNWLSSFNNFQPFIFQVHIILKHNILVCSHEFS